MNLSFCRSVLSGFDVRLRAPLFSQYLGCSLIKNFGNPLRFLGIAPVFAAQRVLQSVARTMHFIGSTSVRIAHAGKCFAYLLHSSSNSRQSIENRFGVRAVCFQMGLALGRNAVELPRTLLLHAGVTDLMQVSQRGINHTRAGRIESARTFFDRLDQFVSVRWLFGEQRQYHQLNVDRVELAAAGKIAAGEVAHKSGASTMEPAAPVMTSVSSRVFSAVFAVVFATVFATVFSGVLSVAFSTVFAAEAVIETC
jgi:hypothetical protein